MKEISVHIEGPIYMDQGEAIRLAKEAIREAGYEVGDFEMDAELNRCTFVGYLEVDPEALILLEAQGMAKDGVTVRKAD